MSLRTDGDFVAASNAACELSALVARFLSAYRKHANGANGVKVPNGDFTVVLKKPKLGANDVVRVCCELIYKHTTTYETPRFFEPDDDNYSEGFGASIVIGYDLHSEASIESSGYLIPWHLLRLSDELLRKHLLNVASAHADRQEEEARQAEISRLKQQLAALEIAQTKGQP